MEWTLQGYGEGSPDFRRRIDACALADGLRVVARRFRHGRVGAAESTMSWLLPRVMRSLRQ